MKIHHTLFITTLCCIFASCTEELARPDVAYQEIPELWIDTTGAPAYGWYTVKQNIEELSISPKVVYTGDKTLDYYWIRSNSYSNTGYPTYDDTISREKDLIMLVTLPLSTNALLYNAYSFFFQVKERETGNMDVFEYKVTVIGAFGTGLLVAHEKDGTADFDLIETPTGANSPVYRDLHQTINGARIAGSPVDIGSQNTGTPVWFATDQHFSVLSKDGLSLLYADEQIFGSLGVDVFKPEAFRGNTLLNNGKVYAALGGVMVMKLAMADGSDYRVDAPLIDQQTNPYLLFDDLNGRLLTTNGYGFTLSSELRTYASAEEGRRFSLDHIGNRKLLYAAQGIYVNSRVTNFGVFQDKADASKKYIYAFTVVTPATPDVALVDISDVTDIQQAFDYQTITTAPVMYYATPEKIYLLLVDVVGGDSVQEAGPQFTAPAGEEITAIYSDNAARCYVATYAAATGEGTVYLVERATGTGLFNSAPTKTWTGFGGRITRMGLKR